MDLAYNIYATLSTTCENTAYTYYYDDGLIRQRKRESDQHHREEHYLKRKRKRLQAGHQKKQSTSGFETKLKPQIDMITSQLVA